MNSPINQTPAAAEPLEISSRKKISSKLDPFLDQLLQMDKKKITIEKMLVWLGEQKVKCSRNALWHFLTTRRATRNHNHLLARLATEAAQCRDVERHFAENPAPKFETLMKLFRLAASRLTIDGTTGAADLELIKIANQLAHTALLFELGRIKAKFMERQLVMAEAKHVEWVKSEQTRALELCLKESKKFPLVARAFRNAFNALRDTQTPALREIETPPSPAWTDTISSTAPAE